MRLSVFTTKGALAFFSVLAFVAGITVALMHRRTTASRYPTIKAEGIKELGLQLEIPGGGENPGDFVIRNLGEHTVVGYRVVYEAHPRDGEVHEWSAMVIQPLAFPRHRQRKPEHLSPRYNCIPPGSVIFGGLRREQREQDGQTIPKLERVWVPPLGLQAYDHIDVRVDSVMLENGQIRGRNKGALIGSIRQTFEEQMKEFLGFEANSEDFDWR